MFYVSEYVYLLCCDARFEGRVAVCVCEWIVGCELILHVGLEPCRFVR